MISTERAERAMTEEEMLLEYLLKTYKITPQAWTQVKEFFDTAIAQAVAAEQVEIAHRLRVIFRDGCSFYEVKECLALADELDPALRADAEESTK